MQIRKCTLLFVSILTIMALVAHGTAQSADDHETEAAQTSDYFDHVTLFSDGRITRFTQMPIRVHISPTLRPLPYLTAIRYAMNTWESATGGKIRFQETETPEQADIRVNPTYSGRLAFLDTRLGSAKLTRLSQGTSTTADQRPNTAIDFAVEVVLVLEGDGTIGELSEEEMRTVCLHELGHAIGLWGHSPDADDACHATATAQHPTTRDVNTLLKVYDTPLHTPQHDIAIDLLKKETQENPRLPRPHYLLGAVYFDKGDMTSAITSFQNCLKVDPNYEPAKEKLIQAYQKTGQSNQATRLIEQRVKNPQGSRSFHESADSYNRLGTLYYRQGDMDKAIEAFEKALKRSPHHKTAKQNLNQLYRQKAFNALKRRTFDEATTYFEKAIRLDPLNATTYRIMGDGYALASEFPKAITHYQKALKLAPDDAEVQKNLVLTYTNHGVTLRNRGEWDAAIRAYRNALELQPTYQIAKTNLIDALSQKANAERQAGHTDDAIETYLELQKLQPNDPTVASLIGELYLLKGRDYPAAISAFHKAYTTQPTDKQAKQNLIAAYQQYAKTLRNRREYAAALEQLQKAAALFPDDINLRLNLSQAYQHVGKYEQASAELEQILARSPNHTNAKIELVNLQIRRGNTLMNQKKYAAALAAFETIPAAEKTIDIQNMIGYLYLMQREHLKALATFETILTQQPANRAAYQNLLSLESQLDVMLSKAKASAAPVSGTGEAASTPDPVPDPIAEKLSRVRCVLARCLMNRKQPKNAMEKYRQALDAKPYAPELRTVLIDTGKQLANRFQKQNDTERYDTITRWIKEHTNESL